MSNKALRPMMLVGTNSDAGKSIINTAFCRIFKQDGFHPAPFKAQNMSLNSFSTPDGLEIGRAQAIQAEACKIFPSSEMNPILLKPSGDLTSQIVLNGLPNGNLSAHDYFTDSERMDRFFNIAKKSFSILAEKYNPIVMEGAGSISEINLRDRDFTNMRMAKSVNASVFLIADIDRGGVFGSVYGTVMLLQPDEKALLKGIIINKFRGDITLFNEGKKMMEELTGIPVVGIVPWFDDIHIEEEDSVELETKTKNFSSGKINVAVIKLDHLSNFTDFDVLERDSRFNLYYSNQPNQISLADIIIIPGSKNTIGDLQSLKATHIAETIVNAAKTGKTIIGICSGYQMMGEEIHDPNNIESNIPKTQGLGLLPLITTIEKSKVVKQRQFHFLPSNNEGTICKGYEIHMGNTVVMGNNAINPLTRLDNGNEEGCLVNKNCWGTYMHGIFDNICVLNFIAEERAETQSSSFDYASFKDKQYDKLAELVRSHCDMETIYRFEEY